MQKWNLAFGVVACGLGYWLQHYASSFPAGRAGVPGPGFFPAALGWTIFGLGILLTAAAWFAPEQPCERSTNERMSAQNVARLAGSVGLLVMWILAWTHVPFEISCTMFVFAAASVQDRSADKRNLVSNLMLAAILCVLVLAIFRYGLSVFI